MTKSNKPTRAEDRRIAEQRIVDSLLKENIGPDTAKLYRAIVRRLYDDLKTLPPLTQLNLVTSVCAMLFKVSSSSSAYAGQNSSVIDATTDIDELPAPKKSLTDIMSEKLNSD